MLLEHLTSPAVRNLDLTSRVVVVPLGSLEQHGNHLPLITDSAIVGALARAVDAELMENVITLPTLWLGHSTHHLAFPGTVSAYQEHYVAMIVDVCRSLVGAGARRIFLLNGHGGNDIPVRYALREVKSHFGDRPDLHIVFASYWHLAADTLKAIRESGPGGVGHACEMETSVMLHLHPELVDTSAVRRDGPEQVPPYRTTDMLINSPVYEVYEFNEVSETGTIGHPDLASAEKGARFFQGIVRDLVAFVQDFRTW